MVYLVSFDSDPTGSDVEKTHRKRIVRNWSGQRTVIKWGEDFNVGNKNIHFGTMNKIYHLRFI